MVISGGNSWMSISCFTSVIIAAGGKGTRMGTKGGKQFLHIDGKTVLERTVHAFENCDAINEIIIVTVKEDVEKCRYEIIEKCKFSKVVSIVEGGQERQESVYNGLKAINVNCDIVLIHDGARPFVSDKTIKNSIVAAKEHGAVCVAVPVKDTIKMVSDCFIEKTLERSKLWAIQTPQAFKKSVIIRAHESALKEGFMGTDDAVLAEHIGYKVKIVEGDYFNIKITTREDLAIADAIIKEMERIKPI
jgi:2-C-methyl-D-erythritol 4-phosphate cytidylyltransferase